MHRPSLNSQPRSGGAMYYARYRDEVQAQIDANAALT
jgi:hypothetical protein